MKQFFYGILFTLGIITIAYVLISYFGKSKSLQTPPHGNGSPCIVKQNGVDVNGVYSNCETNCICVPNLIK